eukprot:9744884-Alexandrium_andersonii.AAC.1
MTTEPIPRKALRWANQCEGIRHHCRGTHHRRGIRHHCRSMHQTPPCTARATAPLQQQDRAFGSDHFAAIGLAANCLWEAKVLWSCTCEQYVAEDVGAMRSDSRRRG